MSRTDASVEERDVRADLRRALDILARAQSGSDGTDLEGSGALDPSFVIGAVTSRLAIALERLGDREPIRQLNALLGLRTSTGGTDEPAVHS